MGSNRGSATSACPSPSSSAVSSWSRLPTTAVYLLAFTLLSLNSNLVSSQSQSLNVEYPPPAVVGSNASEVVVPAIANAGNGTSRAAKRKFSLQFIKSG